MTLDPQFRDWMLKTVSVQNVNSLSTDGYGTRSFGTAFNWQCRIEQISNLITGKDGKEVKSTATLYGPPYDATTSQGTITIGPTAKITLPSGVLIAGTSQPPVLNVEEHPDDTGIMYYAVYL